MQEGPARMRLVSGGVKAKQMVHYPLGSKLESGNPLWITEGERKADTLYQKFNVSACGVPGVGSIEYVLEPACKVGSVVLALDKDDAGIRASYTLAKRLVERGIKVEVARWEKYKKIDDAILNNVQINLLGIDSSCFVRPTEPKKQVNSGVLSGEESILAYIRAKGSVLRAEVPAHPATISTLIRTGKLNMEKTEKGQLLWTK
jgi:hypothetical protein